MNDFTPQPTDKINGNFYINFLVQLINACDHPFYPEKVGTVDHQQIIKYETQVRNKERGRALAHACLRDVRKADEQQSLSKQGLSWQVLQEIIMRHLSDAIAQDQIGSARDELIGIASQIRDMFIDSQVRQRGSRQELSEWYQRVIEGTFESVRNSDSRTLGLECLYFMQIRARKTDKKPIPYDELEHLLIVTVGELMHRAIASEMGARDSQAATKAGFKDKVKKRGRELLEEMCAEFGYNKSIISFSKSY
jgi:hypothetical protein